MSETIDAWTYKGGATKLVDTGYICLAVIPSFGESGKSSSILRARFLKSGDDGVLGIDCQAGKCPEHETQFQLHFFLARICFIVEQ